MVQSQVLRPALAVVFRGERPCRSGLPNFHSVINTSEAPLTEEYPIARFHRYVLIWECNYVAMDVTTHRNFVIALIAVHTRLKTLASQAKSVGILEGDLTACADDIQKYCANADRKRRCLRDNIDKLSDTCKAAVGQRGGRRGRGKDDSGSDE